MPDLTAIATRAQRGCRADRHAVRVGEQLRVGCAARRGSSGGGLIWSDTSQVSVGDLFRLQDDLSRRIVESLALPFSGRERRALGHDVPASAKAYEFYLRANQLSRIRRRWTLRAICICSRWRPIRSTHRHGRGLATCIASPESSAASRRHAWPRRVRAQSRARTESDPLDGRPRVCRDRSRRTVGRKTRWCDSSDAHHHAAATPTVRRTRALCRYCGLPEASLAAGARARRLDHQIRTSLAHTSIMLGDYVGAAEQADQQYAEKWISMAMLGHADAVQQCRVDAERARIVKLTWLVNLIEAWGDMLEGRGQVDALCAATEAVFRLPPDLDGWFYAVLGLAQFGGDRGADRAVQALADLVTRGFFPYDTFIRHAWLQRLRHRSDFAAILDRARHRQQEARAAFIQAGGEALLGAGVAGPAD